LFDLQRAILYVMYKKELVFMTTISIAEARNKLADVINRVSYGGERFIFARRGKAVAALISAEDLQILRRIEDANDIRDALKAIREYEHNPSGAVTLAEYAHKRRAKG